MGFRGEDERTLILEGPYSDQDGSHPGKIDGRGRPKKSSPDSRRRVERGVRVMSPKEKKVLPTGETDVLVHHHVDRRDGTVDDAGPLKIDVHHGSRRVRGADREFTDRGPPPAHVLQGHGLLRTRMDKCGLTDVP